VIKKKYQLSKENELKLQEEANKCKNWLN
jgi:hypothetical protein